MKRPTNWQELVVCSVKPITRRIQTAEASAYTMADDWASQFRPGALPEEEPEPVAPEVVVDNDRLILALEAIVKRLDAMDARLGLYEQAISNPAWLPQHIDNLRQLHHLNAEAILMANQQFSGLVIRKLDEMEERIKSDEPTYTNVLYSDPELFQEISSRPDENELSMDEEFAAKNKIFELLEEEQPEILTPKLDIPAESIFEVPEDIRDAYHSWKNPEMEGTWQTFVKATGGPVKAKKYRELIEDQHNPIDSADD